ncbi:OLC1v1025904C1 [Oldenlandia corymbosa var. corymbosa]|uniref:Receptor-like serine/threonine-protein kinase n=1 Tax=Oldenlandia corymbosa var. corymbosa TaxID=529605 RepID=A0AAV1C5Y8_OLDCO|nr:OLC1v1025904C1 [Oldenlandia corymbosa var. corymbosa]
MLKLTQFKLLVLLLGLFYLAKCSLCRAADTILMSQPIKDPEEILSSGHTFKLGFFSPENGSGNRYVGVMMNVPSQTVIWVANRDRPLKDSSGLMTVSEDGNLVVMNGQKEILWSSNVPFPVANSSAQLLDNGDLVLRENSSGRILWESFQVPADSWVEDMRLGGSSNDNIKLTSWRSPSDPSIGNFSFGMDPLRMPEFFIWNGSKPYWRSGPWNGNVYIGVPGMYSTYQNKFELVNENGSVFFTYSFFNDSASFYYVLSSSGKPDGFMKLQNVKVPDRADLIEFFKANTEEQCSDLCRQNCSCKAFSYNRGIGCLHWSSSLTDIQQFTFDGADLYIRLSYSELDHALGKGKQKAMIASIVSIGSLLIVISAYLLWKCLAHRGNTLKISRMGVPLDNLDAPKIEELPLYSFQTLANATDNFDLKNKLGEGGFGPVYKGRLLNGQEIAVKRLSSSSTQGIKELTNEVVLISKLQHRNLVKLLGCCFEREEKMLIYEYVPNKSLDVYLFDSLKCELLDWNRRVFIIEGIGRGLLYLHRDSRLKVIHRDLKASNILLDKELNPRISDFGLARIFGSNQDQANTNRVIGTYGYMAPEYAMRGKFSEKSDVYSFGVLLLEIVSGKRNTSFFHEEENLTSLLGYAWKLWNDNQAVNLAFTEGFDSSTEMEILRYVHVGLLCVQESSDDRPNMSTVLSMLNREIGDLPPPKLPAYTARIISHSEDHSPQSERHSVNDLSLTDVHGR